MAPPADSPAQSIALGNTWYIVQIALAIYLTLGLLLNCMTKVSKAASLMGRKSAQARIKKWGKKEFVRRMQEWGKLGGRPKGSGKKQKRGER